MSWYCGGDLLEDSKVIFIQSKEVMPVDLVSSPTELSVKYCVAPLEALPSKDHKFQWDFLQPTHTKQDNTVRHFPVDPVIQVTVGEEYLDSWRAGGWTQTHSGPSTGQGVHERKSIPSLVWMDV